MSKAKSTGPLEAAGKGREQALEVVRQLVGQLVAVGVQRQPGSWTISRTVGVLERRGQWYTVQNPEQDGWVTFGEHEIVMAAAARPKIGPAIGHVWVSAMAQAQMANEVKDPVEQAKYAALLEAELNAPDPGTLEDRVNAKLEAMANALLEMRLGRKEGA